MKNILSFVSVLMTIMFITSSAHALSGCETGFACTIKDLEQEQKNVKKEIKKEHNSIKKDMQTKPIKTKNLKSQKYEDIFVFISNL